MDEAVVNVYGEGGVNLRYCMRDLMWRPVGRLVRFVAVIHPTKGSILLMSTDLTLCAQDIIKIYGLRFKIICGRPHMIFYVATRDMWRRGGSTGQETTLIRICATYRGWPHKRSNTCSGRPCV
jgi:hypothetical protein